MSDSEPRHAWHCAAFEGRACNCVLGGPPAERPPEHQAAQNTDRELWRERPGDYYADSLFVTEGGGIGMNVGGFVIVKPIREWHAALRAGVAEPTEPSEEAIRNILDQLYIATNTMSGDQRIEGLEIAVKAIMALRAGGPTALQEVHGLLQTVQNLQQRLKIVERQWCEALLPEDVEVMQRVTERVLEARAPQEPAT